MNAPQKVTLCVRPSLACPERWSVDCWLNENLDAAYQASLFTFDTKKEAQEAAAAVRDTAFKGWDATLTEDERNASRQLIPPPQDTEEDLQKRLEKYIEKTYAPLKSLSFSALFDWSSWPGRIKKIATQSPFGLGLLILLVLLFHGPLDKFAASVVPTEFGMDSKSLLAFTPLLILATTLFINQERVKLSVESSQVLEWVTQLVVHHRWDREKFVRLSRKESEQADYASANDLIQSFTSHDETSLANLVKKVSEIWPDEPEEARQTIANLLRDDFARKVQNMVGMTAEKDYRPGRQSVSPWTLIMTAYSVNAVLFSITTPALRDNPAAFQSVQQFNAGCFALGLLITLAVILSVVLTALVWTTAISWGVSPVLFVVNIVASLVSLYVLLRRPFALLFRPNFLPKGFNFGDCQGAIIL